MAYNNGIITAPVSVYDIQRVLGVGSPDVGTLCKHANINKWAKYKPVRLNLIDITPQWDYTNNVWRSSATWYKGNASIYNAYGWAAPYNNSLLTLLNSCYNRNNTPAGTHNGWESQLPRGGSYNEPYRLTDFAQYNHKAYKPSNTYSCNDTIYVPNNNIGVVVAPTYIKRISDDDPINLRSYITPVDVLKEMWGASTIYEGFAIVKQDYSAVVTFTTDQTMTIKWDNVSDGTPSAMQLKSGDSYYICPFYTNTEFSGAFTPHSMSGSVMFATFPFLEPVLTTVTKRGTEVLTGVSVDLRAEYNDMDDIGAFISGYFSFTDTNGGSRDITNVTVDWHRGNDSQPSGRQTFDTIHVANHETVTRRFLFSNVKIKLYGSGNLLKSVVAIRKMDRI